MVRRSRRASRRTCRRTRRSSRPTSAAAHGIARGSMLAIEELHVYYGEIHALKGVAFEVRAGEIVTILGNNGAGKTTTLKTISGLLAPRRGRIVLEGRRIFNRLSVRENLMMGAYRRKDGAIATDLERVLALFPVLRERSAQVGGTLSGGEQQMLAIGRALMARPRLLLLDEPSMGLSPVIVEKI